MAIEEQEPAGVPAPLVLAMVVCDHVWQDPLTRKATLLGCVEQYLGAQFPLEISTLTVYIVVSGGRGTATLTLEISDIEEEYETLFHQTSEVEFVDPREVLSIGWEVTGLVLPKPGEYLFNLFANNQFLMSRRHLAIQV